MLDEVVELGSSWQTDDVERVRLFGYWRSDEAPDWPDPRDFIDTTWDPEEQRRVALYLREGFVPWYQMGFSHCRLCGISNGSAELTDGVYLWPEGLSHYVAEHSVRLPAEVIAHVLARLDAFKNPDIVDDSWWRSVRPDFH